MPAGSQPRMPSTAAPGPRLVRARNRAGILRNAVQPDLEMQVRAGRASGRAHAGHALAAHDEIAFVDAANCDTWA